MERRIKDLEEDEYVPITPLPFLIFGTTKPFDKINIKLGKQLKVISANKKGEFLFDLNSMEYGYQGYKVVYINGRRMLMGHEKGFFGIRINGGKNGIPTRSRKLCKSSVKKE